MRARRTSSRSRGHGPVVSAGAMVASMANGRPRPLGRPWNECPLETSPHGGGAQAWSRRPGAPRTALHSRSGASQSPRRARSQLGCLAARPSTQVPRTRSPNSLLQTLALCRSRLPLHRAQTTEEQAYSPTTVRDKVSAAHNPRQLSPAAAAILFFLSCRSGASSRSCVIASICSAVSVAPVTGHRSTCEPVMSSDSAHDQDEICGILSHRPPRGRGRGTPSSGGAGSGEAPPWPGPAAPPLCRAVLLGRAIRSS